MLYYLETRTKMNLPSTLFIYLWEMIREIIYGDSKTRKWIPFRILISGVLVESQLVNDLVYLGLIKDLQTDVGNFFNCKTWKNMLMIIVFVDSKEINKEAIITRKVEEANYPLFTKQDPL